MKPKLHALTSKDNFRPVMGYGLLTKERIVVSNASALVAHLCTSLFDDDFISSIPEEKGILIPAATLKEMNKQSVIYKLIAGKVPEMEFYLKGQTYSHKLQYNGDDMTFPKWESVVPEKFEEPIMEGISVNARMLFAVMQAVCPNTEIIQMRSAGETRAIGVFDRSEEYPGCIAIIMPCNNYN